MLADFFKSFFLMFLVGTLSFSCGDDTQYQGQPDLRENELVQGAVELNNQIVQGNSLAAATSRDRQL